MKSAIAFLLATVVLAVHGATIDVEARANRFHGQTNKGVANKNNNANKSKAKTTSAAAAANTVAASDKKAGHHNNNNNNNSGSSNSSTTSSNNNSGGGDPQTSLTLDPSVICTACTDDGQNPPVAGQSASLTSSNNFINFCQGKTLTNGQQVITGSCNGVVYGDIIPSTSMPAAKISFPQNQGTFPANTNFTFTMNIQNMVTGNFVNANTNYYGAPQQLQNGVVVGHSHVTVQLLDSIDTTTPADPTVFAFFKGINTEAVNGVLSVPVVGGLPAGVYRFCTMNTSANHTPALVAIAQHGSLDDCIYATAVDNGSNNSGAGSSNTDTGSSTSASVADAASSTTAAADAAATSSAASGNKHRGGKGGKSGRGRHGGRGRHAQ